MVVERREGGGTTFYQLANFISKHYIIMEISNVQKYLLNTKNIFLITFNLMSKLKKKI